MSDAKGPDVSIEQMCRNLLDQCERDGLVSPGRCRPQYLNATELTGMANLLTKYLAAAARDATTVKMPTTAEEAKGMLLIGERWLKDNAPHELRAAADRDTGAVPPDVAEAAKYILRLPTPDRAGRLSEAARKLAGAVRGSRC